MYVVLDLLANTSPSIAAADPVFDVKDANFGEALRGVSFTPGSDTGFFIGQ